jgi:hypothetical protein
LEAVSPLEKGAARSLGADGWANGEFVVCI